MKKKQRNEKKLQYYRMRKVKEIKTNKEEMKIKKIKHETKPRKTEKKRNANQESRK